jgi:redox-sensitive bicupin YhaK (pirin superfamily)
MITLRQAQDRGRTNLSWLDSRHTFSFGGYRDPQNLGFGALRVINDDRVAAGQGFDVHPHHDMEILTWVLAGSLAHRDSTGGGGVLHPGDAQVMSAGTGLTHSEFNGSQAEPVHFLQVWILPRAKGLPPRYEQRTFPQARRTNRWCPIASPDGRDDSVMIYQDALVYVTTLEANAGLEYHIIDDRKGWLHVARGAVVLGPHALREGDGVAVVGPEALTLRAEGGAEVMLFDLPG